MSPLSCYQFNRAIVRRPAPSVTDGLRAIDKGAPDYPLMCAQHDDYINALRLAGAEVIELPSLESYPDACFVEDTAICLPEVAVMMRPGAPTRVGEVAEIEPALRKYYETVITVDQAGNIEGGDILVCADEILVGLSARTNKAGVGSLSQAVAPWKYRVRELETPEGVLHFKTDCGLLDGTTVLATERLAATGCFSNYRIILTAPGEEAAANLIRFNHLVIMPSGFPETAERLRQADYDVREVDNSECAKIDGGMSCLSLRLW